MKKLDLELGPTLTEILRRDKLCKHRYFMLCRIPSLKDQPTAQ